MSRIKNRIVWSVKGLMARFMVWVSKPALSWWRTLFVNFYFLPFKQARKFPIYVYGKLKITKLEGTIEIDCADRQINRGMIKLNYPGESPGLGFPDTEFILGKGKIIFTGNASILRNSKYLLWGDGTLRLGSNVHIGYQVNIACCNYVEIGNKVRTGPGVSIYDTDFHFSSNNKNLIKRNFGSVIIGSYCWIGAHSSIMKNVVLPDFTTVASNSLVNKNVTKSERCLIAGTPARLIVEGFSRVFNYESECKLFSFFKNNPTETEYKFGDIEFL